MATTVDCPNCRSENVVPESFSGTTLTCISCASPVPVSTSANSGSSLLSMELDSIDDTTAPDAADALELEESSTPERADVPTWEPPKLMEVPTKDYDNSRQPVPTTPRSRDLDEPDDQEDEDDRPAPRRRRTSDRFEECPFCAEEIPWGADRCRHCGEDLDDEDEIRNPRPTRRDSLPHRGGTILGLGIGSLVLCAIPILGVPMGVTAWVLGHGDLHRIDQDEVDPKGRDLTQSGMICGIIGTVLGTILTLVFLGMFWVIYETSKPITPAPRFGPAPTQRKF